MSGLIGFLTNVLILCLFFRFVSIRKHYYVRGLLMNGILRLTDKLVLPFQPFAGSYSALVAIAVAVLVRGVLFGLFNGIFSLVAVAVSVIGFVNFSAEVLFLFLCFSFLLSKQGYHATFNVFIEFIHDVAFDCFRLVKKVLRTESIGILFLASLVLLVAVHSAVYSLVVNVLFKQIAISVRVSSPRMAVGISLITLLQSLSFYTYVLFFYALMSWFRPDPYAEPVQLLTALATPFVETVRKYFPWARFGMLDLSVLVAILIIYFLQRALINVVSVWLLT